MNFIGGLFFHCDQWRWRAGIGVIGVISEIKATIAFCAPAAVVAVDITTTGSEQRYRAHDFDGPRIHEAFDLDDLMTSAADNHIELGLTGRSNRRFRIE